MALLTQVNKPIPQEDLYAHFVTLFLKYIGIYNKLVDAQDQVRWAVGDPNTSDHSIHCVFIRLSVCSGHPPTEMSGYQSCAGSGDGASV